MKALANSAIVSLRSQPSAKAVLADEVLYGMPVQVLETVDIPDDNLNSTVWCRVQTHYRYEGYCRMDELLTGERVAEFQDEKLATVMQPYADVLSEPRVQGICMQSVTRGGRLRVIESADANGWVKVELVDGTCGYIKEKYLGPLYLSIFTENEEEFRAHVVETAKLYLGTQYRWGGKSPLGIDCSGLTSMSYMLCGVFIYRDAQIRDGFPVHEIPFEEKKPGDLIFFPGHIAMYIGNDQYIHSTGKNGSDGVVINSFNPNDECYRPDLVENILYTGSIF